MVGVRVEERAEQFVVRRPRRESRDRIAQQGADAPAQLGRGELGEGGDENAIDREVRSLEQQAQDEAGDGERLAGAGAGLDQHRALADRGLLQIEWLAASSFAHRLQQRARKPRSPAFRILSSSGSARLRKARRK